MNTPEITVFIALYNAEKFIKETIQSILNQTFTDYEILIINDGSTDKSVEVIEKINDSRIRLLHNSENKGICYTRQRGIEEAKAKYIAILDSDDIAEKDRLKLQYDFLENNPQFVACGSYAKFIDENSNLLNIDFNIITNYDSIKLHSLFSNQFINSSVMLKKNEVISIGGYKKHTAEDYDLFIRLAEKYPITNLSQKLVRYRIHNNGDSKIRQDKYFEAEKEILKYLYQKLEIDSSLDYIPYLIFTENFNEIKNNHIHLFFKTIICANNKKKIYNVELFNKEFIKIWSKIVISRKNHKESWKLVLDKNFRYSYLTSKQKRKIFKLLINPF